eukprot:scaffold10417_cov137-Skeletonema_marinoi.AAC.31
MLLLLSFPIVPTDVSDEGVKTWSMFQTCLPCWPKAKSERCVRQNNAGSFPSRNWMASVSTGTRVFWRRTGEAVILSSLKSHRISWHHSLRQLK